jgi:hypothetical protein
MLDDIRLKFRPFALSVRRAEDIEHLPPSPCHLGKRFQPNPQVIFSPSQQVVQTNFDGEYYGAERARCRARSFRRLSPNDSLIPLDSSVDTWMSPAWILLQLSSGGVIEPRYAFMINIAIGISISKLMEPFISNKTTKDAKLLPDSYLFSSGILSGSW